jgi:site-specific DNA-methyltransferase (adenine-specific)
MREERIGDARLLMGDCREILPGLGPVDHIITDPPYEDEMHAAVGRINRIRCDGRQTVDDLGFGGINTDRAEVARLLVEASSGWAIIFCLAEGVRAWRDDLQACGAKWDTVLAWVKPDASPRFNGQGAARGFECAATVWCGKGYRRWNGGGRRGVFIHPVNAGRQGEHPTEKPLPLMMDLVGLYTQPGQTVLDAFAGSGTTGVACARLGRRFVGVERDQRWFDLSCRRIEAAYRQADLFLAPPAPKPEQPGLFAA